MPESLPTKPPFNEIALEAIKKIQQPLLLYGIVVSILLIFLLVMGRDVPSGLRPIVFALPGIVCLIAISHFTLEYFKRRPAIDSHSDISGVSVKRVFARSDSAEFCSCIESLIRHSHRLVVLIGTGLNILQRDPFAEEVMKRATEGHCRLEIYLADPSSPDVEVRLIEEELGDTSPPVGQPGLSRRLNTLMRLWERSGYSEDISINLFTHYPTFALLIVDNEYFFYPYGYATLGNFSPVLQFSSNRQQDDGIIEFLEKQYKRIKASALDTRIVFSVRNKPKPVDAGVLHPLAVYFIPPEDSDLYKFGTEVLGYDIRRGRSVASHWAAQVGGARDFGFHLTMSDVLYFFNPAEVARVKVEVEFLAKEFRAFVINDLCLATSFPDDASLSITVKDPSGRLEAFHHELVQRVYRRAAASNYSLHLADLTRDPDVDRARLMVKRYKAPYILHRYYPHFTLLTQVAPEEQARTSVEIERLFLERVKDREVRVEKLAFISRSSINAPWVIEKEIDLA